MIVWCEKDGGQCQINALICVYSCAIKVKELCKTYAENYEKIKALLIEQKYLTKYGIPNFVEPKSIRKKKKAPAKEGPKKTRTPKEEVEAVKVEEKPVAVPVNQKQKRKRRTKAEMEAARGK